VEPVAWPLPRPGTQIDNNLVRHVILIRFRARSCYGQSRMRAMHGRPAGPAPGDFQYRPLVRTVQRCLEEAVRRCLGEGCQVGHRPRPAQS
jgi:hypothetical protein